MAKFIEVDGAGNRFVLWDVQVGEAPDLCATGAQLAAPGGAAFAGAGADGTLAVLPGEGSALARLVIVNRDGSRPEMCGNGLRCVAAYLAAEGRAPRGERFTVATDAGPLECFVSDTGRASVRLAEPTLGEGFQVPFPGCARGLPAFGVDVGNPHAVLDASHLGVRLAEAPLAAVAEAVLGTGRFPAGANVELVEVHGDHLRARVLERGVGETAACGTGAAAIAAVARGVLGFADDVRVHMPGGVLEVRWEDTGGPWLSGPVRLGRRLGGTDSPEFHQAP